MCSHYKFIANLYTAVIGDSFCAKIIYIFEEDNNNYDISNVTSPNLVVGPTWHENVTS